jgi:hypothetical protein
MILQPESIERRIRDIKNELHSLESLKSAHEDSDMHLITEQQEVLFNEQQKLTDLLDSYFDTIIGL